jgi:hypothetical protein
MRSSCHNPMVGLWPRLCENFHVAEARRRSHGTSAVTSANGGQADPLCSV